MERNMDKQTLVKPVTMIREDFIKNVINLCNNSELPFFIIEDILKNLLQEIHTASQRQLESDKKKYKQELERLQTKSEEDDV